MADQKRLTKSVVKALAPQEGRQYVVWDTQVPGFGVRVSPGGAKTFFYQGRCRGRPAKESLGRFGESEIDEYRDQAIDLARNFRKGIRQRRTTDGTLGDLLEAYADVLEAAGKESGPKVRAAVRFNVRDAHKALWATKAGDITVDDCMEIVGALHKAGKARQADKIRSYLKSAYGQAINARHDVRAPKAMRDMQLTVNPAREIQKVQGSSNHNARILSLAEFRAYWRRLQELDDPARSLASLHVLTGGQRLVQLTRVTTADVDRDSMTLTLRDPKGRRQEPRVYQIPLLEQALEYIDGLPMSGRYIFSLDTGRKPVTAQYLSKVAAGVCKAMAEDGELEGEPFSGKHIRATIETRLMDEPYSVSSDVLARLLSHGLGGVQAKHYARDPLITRQRDALQKLWRMLEGEQEPTADVISLEAARA